MQIKPDDLTDPRVVALLELHTSTARQATVHGSAHALDIADLKAPDIRVWTIWDSETLMGVGALKRLPERHGADHGEVKSMHTAQAQRGRGAGGAMLRHIIESARADGFRRLSLETGAREAYFAPAHRLYRRHGFVDCEPFADYVPDPNSLFFTLDLAQALSRP
ncbi:MAG TPA: GNAT family N-acetyltransferase [Asticcacaulis sp.]|nr:GNAT family N-acetyltransferase [Asticcacaulis sp.]